MHKIAQDQNDPSFSVSLVCANALAREGLKRIISADGIEVDTYEHSRSLIKAGVRNSSTEMVVIDCDDLDEDGREIAELVNAFHDAHLVLLASKLDLEFVVSAFNCGIDGFLLKEISCSSLVGSLHLVALGEKIMPSRMVDHLPQFIGTDSIAQHPKSEMIESLSDREKETLRCLVSGYPNKVIARRMDISEATVKVHVKAILRKLAVQNRTQAAIWAVNNGLVPTHGEQFEDDESKAIPLNGNSESNVVQLQS